LKRVGFHNSVRATAFLFAVSISSVPGPAVPQVDCARLECGACGGCLRRLPLQRVAEEALLDRV
jgi:hypothetical protein